MKKSPTDFTPPPTTVGGFYKNERFAPLLLNWIQTAKEIIMNEKLYTLNRIITSSFSDREMRLSVPAIFDAFQDIAAIHVNYMSLSAQELYDKFNLLWVLSKEKAKIYRLPKQNETITIKTWPLKPSAVRFVREYSILSESGETLICGTSDWCLIDATTRQLKVSSSIPYPTELSDERAGAGAFTKPDLSGEFEPRLTYKVTLSDVDFNDHTNNVCYIRQIVNAFTPDEFYAMDIDEIETHFYKETRYGDEIAVLRKKTDTGYVIKCESNGAAVFAAVVKVK